MEDIYDNELRELARKRVEFRAHLFVYMVMNAALWIIWYVTGSNYMWPIWPTAGWGVGLIFHYLFEYRQTKLMWEEEEYERLKKKREMKRKATS
jgi:hypothetical protein